MASEANMGGERRYKSRAHVIKALAHPTRLFIVDELSRAGERCVYELTEKIGASMASVSRHLALLKDAGILEDDKRGNQVFYRLRIPCVLDFLRWMESIVQGSAASKKERGQ